MPKSELFSPAYNRYVPAILHKNEAMGWLIEYYVLNPITQQLERRRIRLNSMKSRYRTTAEFRVAANEIVCTINARLAGGWTPFGESENIRYYTPIETVIECYITEKAKELKEETMRSYKSFAKMLKEWIHKNCPNCKTMLFNKVLAVRYMDDYYTYHTSNARTYNNQLKLARAFFSWAVEKCYTKENPFEHIRAKKTEKKKRTIVPADSRAMVRAYFEEKCPEMMIVCELIYTSFIRPIEITRITVGMLRLAENHIQMPANITKNGNDRAAPLSDELCRRLRAHVANAKPTDYLFGDNWKPGKTSLSSKTFRKRWKAMREELKLPDKMQLYSLRDSGFFDKLKSGIDPLTVMGAADHHDLGMTTKYADHYDPNMVKIIAEKSPDF